MPELPALVEICEPSSIGFSQAAVLIRDYGYGFSKAVAPQTLPTGYAIITLELGSVVAEAVAGANAALAIALDRQKAKERRDDLDALQRTREYEERVAKQAQIDAEIQATKALLKKLEQQHRNA
jgi:hypothetical protein